MAEFTYEAPNADSFIDSLIVTLNAKSYGKIANLLSGSKCTIVDTKQWARYHGGTIWNANATTINFEVPKSKYAQSLSLTDEEKSIIKDLGNEVIKPNKSGLEITELTFSVLLTENKSLSHEIYKSKDVTYDQTTEFARSLLYTLENALRFFVDTKITEKNGFLEESIQKDWQSSKRKEALPPRKPLDCHIIYYSSFDQLKKIIVQNENWEKIFKPYFGRQNGVISRLNELDDIRDTLAHNRVISEFDFNSFKALYDQIMGCIERSS